MVKLWFKLRAKTSASFDFYNTNDRQFDVNEQRKSTNLKSNGSMDGSGEVTQGKGNTTYTNGKICDCRENRSKAIDMYLYIGATPPLCTRKKSTKEKGFASFRFLKNVSHINETTGDKRGAMRVQCMVTHTVYLSVLIYVTPAPGLRMHIEPYVHYLPYEEK